MSILQSLGDLTLNSLILFLFSFFTLSFATWFGKRFLGRLVGTNTEGDDDLKIILGATLSLLGLLIGFTMSMSISGFNDRQTSEQNEAVTIRSAHLRADLLPEQARAEVKAMLGQYLQDRIRLYDTQDAKLRSELREKAIQEQTVLWNLVSLHAVANQTPVAASILSSINDLVSAQQKTIADWRHQIPFAAWILLIVIALCCNLQIGYHARTMHGKSGLMLILPTMISLAFLMIAEIDAPGRGVIRVAPVNLQSLTQIINN